MNLKNEVQDDDSQLAVGPAPHTCWPGMLLFCSPRRKYVKDKMCGAIVTGLDLKGA